ncbi:MAG: hypothetical protein FJ020_10510, partial [Chloroflexi bacterium]|nr:hypothetical protein [Chloroflexota bacterium]
MPRTITSREYELDQLLKGKTPKVYTSDEAMNLWGIDLSTSGEGGVPVADDWQDWMVEAVPDTMAEGGLSWNLISPQGYKIFEDNSLTTPEGQHYSREEWESLREAPLEVSDTEFLDLVQRVFAEPGVAPPLPEAELEAMRMAEFYGYDYQPTRPGLDFATMNMQDTLSSLGQWLMDYPAEFVAAIGGRGRTADAELLLRKLIPDITDSDISLVFGEIPAEGMRLTPEMFPGAFPDMKQEGEVPPWLQQARLEYQDLQASFGIDKESLPDLIIKPDYSIWWEGGAESIGQLDPNTGQLVTKHDYGWAGQIFFSLEAGTGDLLVAAGSILKRYTTGPEGVLKLPGIGTIADFRWLGEDGLGSAMADLGHDMQLLAPDDNLGAFNWQHLYNPRFYTMRVTRTVPFFAAMIVPSVVGMVASGGLATGLGLTGWASYAAQMLGGAVTSRTLEGALEAGGAYDEALSRGLSVEEANRVADSVFQKNMALSGVDAVQLATIFAPMPARVAARIANSGLVTVARVGGKVVFTGLTEAGEELYQEIVQKWALGDEVDLSDPTL